MSINPPQSNIQPPEKRSYDNPKTVLKAAAGLGAVGALTGAVLPVSDKALDKFVKNNGTKINIWFFNSLKKGEQKGKKWALDLLKEMGIDSAKNLTKEEVAKKLSKGIIETTYPHMKKFLRIDRAAAGAAAGMSIGAVAAVAHIFNNKHKTNSVNLIK
ncbi:MAG: hypothetical protein A2Y25_07195 [Candidatus Melainabacteria bacterium GWF2_37_15]|nr:MAG: hypothetical protein A2Y25_07195 [Candidatus Melainabacteria bacterium GWF2_37_15]